jgi:hypothetical protein
LTNDARLSKLFAVERAEERAQSAVDQGYQTLQRALEANVPALPIAHGPLKVGLSLASKAMVGSGLIAFAVTTGALGIHAALQEPAVVVAKAAVTARASVAPPVGVPAASLVAQELPVREVAPESTSAPVRGSAPPVASSTFAEELRLMKAAKLELDAGRGLLAKVLLDQHEQRYPQGVFRAERERLRARLSVPRPRDNFPDAPNEK